MEYDLPVTVEISGEHHPIRRNADYRVVLDAIIALDDPELTEEQRLYCSMFIFYENLSSIKDTAAAAERMMEFINYGQRETDNTPRPKVVFWEKDFPLIAAEVNQILGYDIRTRKKYTHYWSFLGAYYKIGAGVFQTVVSIRDKLFRGRPLDKEEREYYNEHRVMIEPPSMLTDEDREFLMSDY